MILTFKNRKNNYKQNLKGETIYFLTFLSSTKIIIKNKKFWCFLRRKHYFFYKIFLLCETSLLTFFYLKFLMKFIKSSNHALLFAIMLLIFLIDHGRIEFT